MFNNLEAEMARKKITQKQLANVLNISFSAISDKMNGKQDFKLRECKSIVQFFDYKFSIDYLFEQNNEKTFNG